VYPGKIPLMLRAGVDLVDKVFPPLATLLGVYVDFLTIRSIPNALASFAAGMISAVIFKGGLFLISFALGFFLPVIGGFINGMINLVVGILPVQTWLELVLFVIFETIASTVMFIFNSVIDSTKNKDPGIVPPHLNPSTT